MENILSHVWMTVHEKMKLSIKKTNKKKNSWTDTNNLLMYLLGGIIIIKLNTNVWLHFILQCY